MTWTYDSTDLSTALAKVRVMIGDTVTGDQQLTDEEINFFIDVSGSVYAAASMACEGLAANYAREVDASVGRTNTRASQQVKHYLSLAKQWKSQGLRLAAPIAGGISIAEKETQRGDSDRVQPAFHVGQFDNVESSRDEDEWNAT